MSFGIPHWCNFSFFSDSLLKDFRLKCFHLLIRSCGVRWYVRCKMLRRNGSCSAKSIRERKITSSFRPNEDWENTWYIFPTSVNEWQWMTEILRWVYKSCNLLIRFVTEYPLISCYPFLFSLSQLVLSFSDHFWALERKKNQIFSVLKIS